MLSAIQHFSFQFKESQKILTGKPLNINKFKKPSQYILTGMGGSVLPGDLVNDYLGGEVRLSLVSDYRLPHNIGPKDLVICSSYSGNTEETLAAFDDALRKKAQVIVLTHGGELERRAKAKTVPVIHIPECIQPRCASGYFFTSIVSVLEQLGIIPSQEKAISELVSFLESRQSAQEDIGKTLAAKLFDLVPIIYGPQSLYGACRIFKIKFNENSKIQSFFNVFPELNHNEMVGFTKMLMKPAIIYLKSKFMHPRILQRMAVMGDLLKNKMSFHSIDLAGDNLLQEMFDAVVIGDFTSYYLALAYGVDPAPVAMVEDFKMRLLC